MITSPALKLRARREESDGGASYAGEHKTADEFGPVRVQNLSGPRNLKVLSSAYTEFCRVADSGLALSALLGVFVAVNAGNLPHGLTDFLALRLTVENVLLLVGFLVVWQVFFSASGLYDPRLIRDRREETIKVVAAASLGTVAALAIPFLSSSGAFPAHALLYFWAVVIGATLVARRSLRALSVRTTKCRDVLIVGSGPRAYQLFRDIQADRDCGYRFLGFIDSNDDIRFQEIEKRVVGGLHELESILMRTAVDEVLVALPIRSCYEQIEQVLRVCERVGVESKYLADVFEHALARPSYEPAGDLPVVALRMVHDDIRTAAKRLLDVTAAACGLIVLSPLLLLISIGIKATNPGTILFTQDRYGRNRRLFKMYKFRTMVAEAEALQLSIEHLNEVQGPVFKIKNDPRITPFGSFLRRTSLDELPQLFNVLRGDMSLVGPRPLPVRDVHRFPESWLMRRFSVLPGLTCIWQISGRSNLDFDSWIKLDLQYIDSWSLWMDLKILLRTIPVVIRGTGAS
jgi:exopolysaccharide biosynthesis polyprenyl glycosylphosphotransferase